MYVCKPLLLNLQESFGPEEATRPPFDEPQYECTEEVPPTSESPGLLAAVAGATAAAAAAVYEVTADTITAPVTVVQELVTDPVKVVAAPVELLMGPLIGREETRAVHTEGEQTGEEAVGVKARVEEYERVRKASPEKEPGDAWEVVEGGGKSPVLAPRSGEEIEEGDSGMMSRGRVRAPTAGASHERSRLWQTFSWPKKGEGEEEKEARYSEQ